MATYVGGFFYFSVPGLCLLNFLIYVAFFIGHSVILKNNVVAFYRLQ